jgi:pyridoxal phosphate enzyme (YggS family)
VTQITDQIREIERRIDKALNRAKRHDDHITLVAVSKRQSPDSVREARSAGIIHFGENYLQEGLAKIAEVDDPTIQWHFIGRIQSNKTRQIAERFSWVETLDRTRIADRLNAQRPDDLEPLNVLIQINSDREPQKAGVDADAVLPLAAHIAGLPRLRLRGVMGMPSAANSDERNRQSFLAIAAAAQTLKNAGLDVDTVSMGMSQDYELAIECGSTSVRIGTALFGMRHSE